MSMTSYFEKEIFQQPEVIGNLVQTHSAQFKELADTLRENPPALHSNRSPGDI